MKKFTILIGVLLFATNAFAQNITSFSPKWYAVEEDTTIKDKKLIYNGMPLVCKQDKENNLYVFSFTSLGYQLSKIETKTGKKLWAVGRNQSFGTENKTYYPKDFFFRPDGNIVLFAVKGAKFPGLTTFGPVMKFVYDAKTGKEIFNYLADKKGGSAVALNTGSLEEQIIENPNKKGYYFSDGIGGNKILSWIRTVDTNFVANDTLNIRLPVADTSKGMQLISLSPFHQLNGKFYQMSANFGGTDTSRARTYLTKIDYKNKQYSIKDVSKNWFHGLDYMTFTPIQNGFLVSLRADSTYGPINGLDYKPNIILAKIDTNGTLEWRTYLFPEKSDYKKGFCIIAKDNKTDGYWVVLTSEIVGEKTHLYYMSKNGALKLLGQIKLPDENFTMLNQLITVLDNGDIMISYRTHDKDAVHPIYRRNGTLYFERKQFEALITNTKEENLLTESVNIYPNPVENQLQVLLPTVTAFEYTINDMTGRIVKKEAVIATNFYEVSVQDLAKGMYILNIKTADSQVFVRKIVKQ